MNELEEHKQDASLEDRIVERVADRISDTIYRSHLSIKEVDSGLHMEIMKRLDKQDTVLDTIGTNQVNIVTKQVDIEKKVEELYKYLTNTRTIMGFLKNIASFILKSSAVIIALSVIAMFIQKLSSLFGSADISSEINKLKQ